MVFGFVFGDQLRNVTTENFDLSSFKNGRSWAGWFALQFSAFFLLFALLFQAESQHCVPRRWL